MRMMIYITMIPYQYHSSCDLIFASLTIRLSFLIALRAEFRRIPHAIIQDVWIPQICITTRAKLQSVSNYLSLDTFQDGDQEEE